MRNIDNYISNDAYTEKSLGVLQLSSGFLQENTHFLKNTFSLFMSPTPTLASVNFCLTAQAPIGGRRTE